MQSGRHAQERCICGGSKWAQLDISDENRSIAVLLCKKNMSDNAHVDCHLFACHGNEHYFCILHNLTIPFTNSVKQRANISPIPSTSHILRVTNLNWNSPPTSFVIHSVTKTFLQYNYTRQFLVLTSPICVLKVSKPCFHFRWFYSMRMHNF
jgi:hypothetical protein